MKGEQDAETLTETDDLRQQLAETQRVLKRTQRQLEKSQKDYEDLRQHVETLSAELHELRSAARKEQQEEEKPFPDWTAPIEPEQNESYGNNTSSIADSLKAAAEEAVWEQSGFVYDSTSGMYCDYNSGYYYDSVRSLYYDPNSTAYYYYDETEKTHKFHSYATWPDSDQAAVPESAEASCDKGSTTHSALQSSSSGVKEKDTTPRASEGSEAKKCRRLRKRKRSWSALRPEAKTSDPTGDRAVVNSSQEEEMEAGEIEDSSSDCLSSEDVNFDQRTGSGELADESSLESSLEEDNDDAGTVLCAAPVRYTGSEQTSHNLEASAMYPPCIRIIVQNSDTLDEGTFFLVTCTGGSIGRDKDPRHVLHIPDTNVSKMHAAIQYDDGKQCYTVEDSGSVNGTYVNNQRVLRGNAVALCHGDTLQVGSTCMLLHIHPGNDTCDSCEPGQVMAALCSQKAAPKEHTILSKDEKRQLARRQLKSIKKKYGLEREAYIDQKMPDYSSRKAERLNRVGSEDNPRSERAAEAVSVHAPISADNKGHRMLAKMGWKEGSGLGRDNAGRAEPITVEFRANQSAGLGSAASVGVSLDSVQSSGKLRRILQTRERYRTLEKQQSSGGGDNSQTIDIVEVKGTGGHGMRAGDFTNASKPMGTSEASPRFKMNWIQGQTQKPS